MNFNDKKSIEESKKLYGGYTVYKFNLIPLKDIIIPKVWNPGRLESVNKAIQENKNLPPIRLSINHKKSKWEIEDGIHRANASKNAGFTHIPAICSEWIETPDEIVPPEPQKDKLNPGDWVKLREAFDGKIYGQIKEFIGQSLVGKIKRYIYAITLVDENGIKESFPADFSDKEFDKIDKPIFKNANKIPTFFRQNKDYISKYRSNRIQRKILLKSLADHKTIYDDNAYTESLKEKTTTPVIDATWDKSLDSPVTIESYHANDFPMPDTNRQFFPAPDQAMTTENNNADDDNNNIDLGDVININDSDQIDKPKYRITETTDVPEPYKANKYYGIQDSNREPLNRDWFLDK
jgi:hypothetical protein